MKVSPINLFRQGRVLAALTRTIASSLTSKPISYANVSRPDQYPIIRQTVEPRSPSLVRDYIRHVGGVPSSYRGMLPAHMYPQWGFPLMATTMRALEYNMLNVVNAGCSFEIKHPLPMDQPLQLEAQLQNVDDNGRRVLFETKLVTGTAQFPESVISRTTAMISLPRPHRNKEIMRQKQPMKTKYKPHIPVNAREIARWRLGHDAGLDFGVLTGDLNPVHWVSLYARAAGFKNPILHGYSAAARAVEEINRVVLSGNVNMLKRFEGRFIKPIALPAKVGLFIDEEKNVFVGKAPGGPASFAGSFSINKE